MDTIRKDGKAVNVSTFPGLVIRRAPHSLTVFLVAVTACIGSWWGNQRERAHWEDLGVDGWLAANRLASQEGLCTVE